MPRVKFRERSATYNANDRWAWRQYYSELKMVV